MIVSAGKMLRSGALVQSRVSHKHANILYLYELSMSRGLMRKLRPWRRKKGITANPAVIPSKTDIEVGPNPA